MPGACGTVSKGGRVEKRLGIIIQILTLILTILFLITRIG